MWKAGAAGNLCLCAAVGPAGAGGGWSNPGERQEGPDAVPGPQVLAGGGPAQRGGRSTVKIEQVLTAAWRPVLDGRAEGRSIEYLTGSRGTDRSFGYQLVVAQDPSGSWVWVIGDQPGVRPTGSHIVAHGRAASREAARKALVAPLQAHAQGVVEAHNRSGLPGCLPPLPWRAGDGHWM